jgi:hypothetical protein
MRLAPLFVLLTACSTPPAAGPPAPTGAAAASVPAATAYTCPMHPQIHESAPGKCPICGMNLVPASSVAPAGQGPLEAHDHRALHGGQVSMSDDHHVEYVGGAGEYRFWVTNATREAITSGVSGTVKVGETTLPLTPDNATGLLSAKGEGAGTQPVLVEVTADGTTFSLGFNAMGDAPAHEHHDGGDDDHDHEGH